MYNRFTHVGPFYWANLGCEPKLWSKCPAPVTEYLGKIFDFFFRASDELALNTEFTSVDHMQRISH